MNRILELRQKRTALVGQAAAIIEKARTENRNITAEEDATYTNIFNDADAVRRTLETEERQAALEASLGDQRRENQAATGIDPEQQREAFRTWMRGGNEWLTPEHRTSLYLGRAGAMDFGASEKRAAQSELTGNVGGYIVPTGFYAQVQVALKYYAGMMESGPMEITTTMGNDLPIPTSNDTTNMGQILGESSPETTQEIPFGQVIMKAFKYSSRIILVPIELLQDAGVDIEAFIIDRIAERLGRILNLHFTTGTGTNQPRGFLIDSVLGKTGAAGQTATVIYDDLVDLKYSVNRLYRTAAKWMMGDTTLNAILKIKDSNNRPLILDYLNTLQADEPEKLLGQPIIINNDMPGLGITGSPAVGNKPIAYGAFKNYWVRRVMAMLVMRLVERYADAGQVAFLAFMRADGRLVDAGTNPIKYYANATA